MVYLVRSGTEWPISRVFMSAMSEKRTLPLQGTLTIIQIFFKSEWFGQMGCLQSNTAVIIAIKAESRKFIKIRFKK
ncbi:TPA: hypothetical protein ACWSX7_004836, partial [Escherichia coli]